MALLERLSQSSHYLDIISNGSENSRVRTLEATRLSPLIQMMISSQAAGDAKPSIDIFLSAARQAGYQPEQCCFIGDHPVNDINGALAAGMHPIWLRGFHSEEELPDQVAIVDGLDEVFKVIYRLKEAAK